MSLLALCLVLASACVHATWNLFAKRAGGGPAFLWMFAVVSSVIYGPVALTILISAGEPPEPEQVTILAISALFHLAYITFLQRGYAVADLSFLYPLARGTGPLLASIAAILLLGERPSMIAVIGIGAVSTGVFLMAWAGRGRIERPNLAVALGIATGVFIAGYTIADKVAVDTLAISPVVLIWVEETVRVALLAPIAFADRPHLAAVWRDHRREALIVGIFGPISYILMLTALQLSPASYVAPAREFAIVIGVLLGIRFLGEPRSRPRLVAASVIVAGVICLAIG